LIKITNRKAGEKPGSSLKILSMAISQIYKFSDFMSEFYSNKWVSKAMSKISCIFRIFMWVKGGGTKWGKLYGESVKI